MIPRICDSRTGKAGLQWKKLRPTVSPGLGLEAGTTWEGNREHSAVMVYVLHLVTASVAQVSKLGKSKFRN